MNAVELLEYLAQVRPGVAGTVPGIIVLVCGLGWALVTDLSSRLIKNETVCILIVAALSLSVLQGGFSAGLMSLSSLLLVFVFILPLFASGGMGGGDLKLLSATAAFFSPPAALAMVILVFLCGGVFAMLAILRKQFQSAASQETNNRAVSMPHHTTGRLQDQVANRGIAYAPAIASGALFTVLLAIS